MLKTGKEHLECLRDGRVVYIGGEKVDDVTTHPAFAESAKSMAALYDMKADPANRDVMSYEEDGERFSMYYLRPKNQEDLRKRMRAHKRIADETCGLFGRSPDHVSSFVTGLAMKPDVFDKIGPGYGDNLLAHYDYMRRNDIYAAYAVLPPAGARNPEFYQRKSLPIPSLRVVDERDDGVVISGMKMLATGGVYADELWIGNLLPIAEGREAESITCAIACNTPGLTLWSRKPFGQDLSNKFDYPLSAKYDESDAMVLCDNVFVPWEKVFVHDNAEMSRGIYVQTPSHAMGNHQSNIRFWAKMQLMTGVLSRITESSGNNQIPAVADQLGRMAALEATLGGMIHGQIEGAEAWPQKAHGGPEDYVTINRRYMYAALNWCTENHSMIIEMLRELMGGGVFQMPADVSVMGNPELREKFEQFWATPFKESFERMKLYRLAWDLVGSEFAGRHTSYEKFYAGSYFVVRNHSHREAPWGEFHEVVDRQLDAMELPEGLVP
jgi:4-hydroxyphenylacetate 3-monooxygenase